MSRKHPSFAQLIDYIEGETKLKSRHYSIHHNTYHRDTENLKREFEENAQHLKARKNGVYLYHEILSVSRSQAMIEDTQKATLKTIVREYLNARAKNNLAYAVLHEDTDNLHFHIVLSSNEVGDTNRKRLSKAQFADIQTRLESWVLQTYPELEQKAVFHQNQTPAERADRTAKREQKAKLSNPGEEMKRRGAKTEKRDTVQETLAKIFEMSSDPRDFADRMQAAGFALYTRGQTHGVTDRDGTKYRLNRLGLAEAWQALDTRMTEDMQAARRDRTATSTTKETTAAPTSHAQQSTRDQPSTPRPEETPKPQDEAPNQAENEAKEPSASAYEAEAEQRLAEMKAYRAKRATRDQQRASTQSKPTDRDR